MSAALEAIKRMSDTAKTVSGTAQLTWTAQEAVFSAILELAERVKELEEKQ